MLYILFLFSSYSYALNIQCISKINLYTLIFINLSPWFHSQTFTVSLYFSCEVCRLFIPLVESLRLHQPGRPACASIFVFLSSIFSLEQNMKSGAARANLSFNAIMIWGKLKIKNAYIILKNVDCMHMSVLLSCKIKDRFSWKCRQIVTYNTLTCT